MLSNELSDSNLTKILKSISNGTLTVERFDLEYKEGFGWKSLAKYMKTMAAFANSHGGYILFGIEDKPCRLIGLDTENLNRFCGIDNAKITENLRNQFNRDIWWDKRIVEYDGMTFGVIYVREAKSKPIISTKAKDTILRKSAVYYRYNSESTEIEPGDLENLIETEKRNLLELFVKKIEFIAQTGVEVATFFNIDDGKLYTPSPTNVIIDSDTLKDLKFIKEGEFTEKEGAPALVLKGTVENINVVDPIIIKTPSPTAILLNQVIEDFLHEKNVENPIEYLKTICNTGTANYPIYYYLKSIGISTDNVIKELQDLGGLVRRKTRDELIKRLSPDSKSYHYQSNAKGDVADMRRSYRRKILSQTLKYPIRMGEKRKQLEYLLQAIRSIDQKEIVKNKEYILKLLNEIYNTDILSCQKNDAAKTEFRKALCWVDEALYKLE